MTPPATRHRVRRSLRVSMYEGACYNAMLGCTDAYVTPFAVALQAGSQAIGMLNALKSLATALPLLASAWLVERFGSRRRCLVWLSFFHAALWVPITLIPFVLPRPWQIPIFITLIAVGSAIGTLTVPAFGSLLADYVPSRMRGRYLGWRNRLHGLVNLVAMFLAGLLLHLARSWEFVGFAVLFGSAALARWLSWACFHRMHESALPPVKSADRVHPFDLLRLPSGNAFTPFVVFTFFFLSAVNLSAPFLAVYLLKELEYSYLTFTIVTIAASLAALLAMTLWGRQADRFGNIQVLKACAIAIVVVPFLWLVSSSPTYLIGTQLFAGAIWAGFNLTITNFAYEAAPPEDRTSYIAALNIVVGLASFCGALAGGWLALRLPSLWGSHWLALIALSGVARLVVVVAFLHQLQDVRRVPAVSLMRLMAQPVLRLTGWMSWLVAPRPVVVPSSALTFWTVRPRLWRDRLMRWASVVAIVLGGALWVRWDHTGRVAQARSAWEEVTPAVARLVELAKAALRGQRSAESTSRPDQSSPRE